MENKVMEYHKNTIKTTIQDIMKKDILILFVNSFKGCEGYKGILQYLDLFLNYRFSLKIKETI